MLARANYKIDKMYKFVSCHKLMYIKILMSLHKNQPNISKVIIMKILAIFMIILFSNPLFAQNTNSCPNRGLDPNTFCLPGAVWDQDLKACITMV